MEHDRSGVVGYVPTKNMRARVSVISKISENVFLDIATLIFQEARDFPLSGTRSRRWGGDDLAGLRMIMSVFESRFATYLEIALRSRRQCFS